MDYKESHTKSEIQENLDEITAILPEGKDLYQASLIESLNSIKVRSKVAKLLDDLDIEQNYSCFDTNLIEDIEKGIQEKNIELSEEQEKILYRIKNIIKLNVGHMKEQLSNAKYSEDNLDQGIYEAENKTLHLLLKKKYNFSELSYFLEQKLDGGDLFIKVHKFLSKQKENFSKEEYVLLYKKLLRNKGANKEYIKGILFSNDIDLLEEKKIIIESGILDRKIIKDILYKEDSSYLWGVILGSDYIDIDFVNILLNKVADNFVKYYTIVKNLLIDHVFRGDKIKIRGGNIGFHLCYI